jgi:hypothetical protein
VRLRKATETRRAIPRRPLIALLAAVAVLVAAGCLIAVSSSPASDRAVARTSAATAPPQANRPPFPQGVWDATGRVLWSVNLAGQHKGSVRKREWAFAYSCRDGRCRTVFTRTTRYGTSVTALKRHGKTFTAVFPPVAVPCLGPNGVTRNRPGRLHDRYNLWWSKGEQRLIAIQHQHGSGGCGLPGRAKFRWTAKLVRPTPATPEPEA